ncbi:efflux RND transporter permease subunit [Candidatus Uabimicrobium sp. HlEnr_7]|uniref:efflux RND transporter permease subunit n=1 Tax=Candidatus Uabimicrobium helgolandensis TaxID=3095367 RepID=UPI0035561A40
MIYKIIEFRKIFFVGSLAFIFSGIITFLQLPRQEDPTIKYNMVRVVVPYPGADPYKVEKLVTKEVEKTILEISGVDEVISVSKNGISSMEVLFDYDEDLDAAIEKLKDKVRELVPKLPSEIHPPIIFDELVKNYSLIAVMTGEKYNLQQLKNNIEILKKQCLDLPGVSDVELRGDLEEIIEVSLHLDKISKYRIPISRIVAALEVRNNVKPAGILKADKQDFLVETQGEFRTLEDIKNVIVDISAEDNPVYIKDLADVTAKLKDPDYRVRYNKQNVVALVVIMKDRYNIFNFQKQVHQAINSFHKPPGIKIEIPVDQANYVDQKLGNLYSNLLQGMICVTFVLFFFVGIRESVIVSISIPLTFIISIFFLGILDVVLQQMSIASLVIALGLLVDNSIIIIENIHKEIQTSDKPWLYIFSDAVEEMAPSIISGTLTTIAAFIPLLFMVGATGAFLRSIPIVVIVTLASSLFVAICLTPILYFWITPKRERGEKSKTKNSMLRYRKFIRFWLKRRYLAMVMGITFIAAGFYLASQMRVELFSKTTRGQFLINVFLPEGSNLDKCTSIAKKIENILFDQKNFTNIESVSCFLGNGSPKFYYNEVGDWQLNNPAFMEIAVNLKASSSLSTTETVYAVQEKLDVEIAGAKIRVRQFQHGKPFKAPVAVRVLGETLSGIKKITQQLKDTLEEIPGTRNIMDNLGEDTYKVNVKIDPYRLNQIRVLHLDVSSDIYTALNGQTATSFLSNDEKIDVVVRLRKEDRSSFQDVRKLYFTSRFTGEKIPFYQLAKLDFSLEKGQINRYNQKWYASVFCDTRQRLASEVLGDLKRKIKGWEIPPGYTIEFEGEDKELQKSIKAISIAGCFAIILIYVILAFEFNSLFQPIIILSIFPVSVAGALFGLYFLDQPLGFMTLMGFVSLAGIVVNDAIILIDCANHKMRGGSILKSYEGYSQILSIVAEERLKPILATSITTAVSLLPLAVWGGAFWAPFAWTVIFGLLTSTSLTLIFTPVVFRIVEDLKIRLGFMPPFTMYVFARESKSAKKISRLLGHRHFIKIYSQSYDIASGSDFAILDQRDFETKEIVQIIQQVCKEPHIVLIIVSDGYHNSKTFGEKIKDYNVSSFVNHVIENAHYIEGSDIEIIPKIVKQNSEKMQSVIQTIWQLSREKRF